MMARTHDRAEGLGGVPRDELRAGLGLWRAELAGVEGAGSARRPRLRR